MGPKSLFGYFSSKNWGDSRVFFLHLLFHFGKGFCPLVPFLDFLFLLFLLLDFTITRFLYAQSLSPWVTLHCQRVLCYSCPWQVGGDPLSLGRWPNEEVQCSDFHKWLLARLGEEQHCFVSSASSTCHISPWYQGNSFIQCWGSSHPHLFLASLLPTSSFLISIWGKTLTLFKACLPHLKLFRNDLCELLSP